MNRGRSDQLKSKKNPSTSPSYEKKSHGPNEGYAVQSDIVLLRARLRDSKFQRGLGWRADKIDGIRHARKNGWSDERIRHEMIAGGITVEKTNELFRRVAELEAYEVSHPGERGE